MELEAAGSKDSGPCSCCGHMSRTVWGYLQEGPQTEAAYYVHWTTGRVQEEGAHFDLVLGRWGDGTSSADRVAVSLELRWTGGAPSFMVIDSDTRPISKSDLVRTALRRVDVIGTPLAQRVFSLVDVVWDCDDRILEVSGRGGRTRG